MPVMESVYKKRFFRRLGVALRSGWACLFVGLLLQFGKPVDKWMAIPSFSIVICLNAVDSSIGAVMRNIVGVLIGMAQAMTISLVVLLGLGTKLSLSATILFIFVASFFVAYPHNSDQMARRVALSHIGIIFTTAHSGQNNQSLFFLVRLMVTTLVGASCALLAVLVPVPGLAWWEARGSAKSAIRTSTEVFQSLVEAFCTRDARTFSSIFLHANYLAKLASSDISELNRSQAHAIWELRGSGSIPTLKRMVKGLNGLQVHLFGMNLALQSGTNLLTPGVMSAILRSQLKGIGEKSKSILELTTNLSNSEAVLLQKQKLLKEGKAEFKLLEKVIMAAREETYYKQHAEDQSLDELIANPNPYGYTANENIRTMVPTYFFLFNLRMFFAETIHILDSGKIANKMHQFASSSHQMRTLERSVSRSHPKRSASRKHRQTEFRDPICGCEYQQPRSTRWKACLRCLEFLGLKLDRDQFSRAFKIALAMSMAALAAIRVDINYAFWATICLGFIVRQHQGGSFRMGSLRLQGTVLGAIYGYLAIMATHDYPYLLLVSLIPWVILLSFLRFTKSFGPAGSIGGLTAAIVILGRMGDPVEDFALIRITENFLGVLSLVIVETLVFPTNARTQARRQFVSSLTDLRDCVANVVAAYTGDYCPKHRRMVVQDIKKLDQELRDRFEWQENLFSEAVVEPDLWSAPFPAEIYSKLAFIQGRMLDLLYFMVSSLHAATEDCLHDQIERLVEPLQISLVALEDEVLSSLDLLQRVLQIKRNKNFLPRKGVSWKDDEENQLGQNPGTSLCSLRKRVGHVHPLLVLEHKQRCIDGTPLSMQSTMDAFEASYEEFVSGFIAAKKSNPGDSMLTNSAMLSFSAVTFSLKSLLRETVELEKAVRQLLHFENPSTMMDFWETFSPGFEKWLTVTSS